MLEDEQLIVGEVEAIYFENDQNYYKVLRISVDHDETDLLLGHDIVVTGQFATIHFDTTYEFYGQMTQHPKYGEQFAVSRYQQRTPTSKEGLIDYLSSYRFKGIGPTIAQRIVEKLGSEAISKIIEDRQVLNNIKGVSSDKADNLRRILIENQGTERIFIQLNHWGFGASLADKIFRRFESQTVDLIQANPYILVGNVEGIGFNKADQLAESLGIEANAKERIASAIYVSILEVVNTEGDTYVPVQEALNASRQFLEQSRPYLIKDEELLQGLEFAIEKELVKELTGNLMIPRLYYSELAIARNFEYYYKQNQVIIFDDDDIEAAISQVETMTAFHYDESQVQALKLAMKSPMSVITGGPGTGKTTLIKGLIQIHAILNDYNLEKAIQDPKTNPILLAAPTGRAAKRMQEATGLPASTIHRLLGINIEMTSEEIQDHELEGSLLIIDEMSMVDTWLMHWLIQAIPVTMQVVFVGDQDQLPSVGPGKVFTDLIESNIIPVLSLTKIYRQSQDSSIIDLAHHVRQGKLPQNFIEKQADRTFIQAGSKQIPAVIEQIVKTALRRGYDAMSLQVLAPMYKGEAGINVLNSIIQDILNPKDKSIREIVNFDTVFREGDKVLQLVNNGEADVYNGDIGIISHIAFKSETESKTDEITVIFDQANELTYKRTDFDQLTLAYCTSIHKAQGSEYPLVLLPLVTRYSKLLRKDVLYTAITRAQKSLIMIGNPNSFYQAATSQRRMRRTQLKDLLEIAIEDIKEDEIETDTEELVLSNETFSLIDPMIGMEGISPYDFMLKT